jgi:hypothetical protein
LELVICKSVRNFTARSMRLALSTLLLACLLAASARAQTLVYPTFSSTAGLQLNDASVRPNSAILLASSASDRRGSFFTVDPYSVTGGFSAVFEFRISSPGGATDGIAAGADGLAFVVQRSGATALGASGEGLGYGPRGGTAGITPSVAVEFDTFRNSWDPSSNHIGINLGANLTSSAFLDLAQAFDSGAKWTVWVDYTGSVLEVRANTTGIRPVSADLTHSINLLSALGGTSTLFGTSAFVGFTGATGSAFGTHEILGFAFSDTYLAGGLAAVPEPSTWALLILGLGAVAVAGWRRRRP